MFYLVELEDFDDIVYGQTTCTQQKYGVLAFLNIANVIRDLPRASLYNPIKSTQYCCD